MDIHTDAQSEIFYLNINDIERLKLDYLFPEQTIII